MKLYFKYSIELDYLDPSISNFFLTYRHHNTKHVHVILGTASINACFQVTGLPGCFASSHLPTSETTVWKPQISQFLFF